MKGTLLTGDRKLRNQVLKDNIEVRGILFVLDELLRQQLLSFELAIQKINLLYQLNNRLPQREKTARLNLWNQKKQI